MMNQHAKNLPEELNPEFLFSLTSTEMLLQIVNGMIDAEAVAEKTLGDRGLDVTTGKWIGFKAS